MKKCSYCGRESADESNSCLECGTAFNPKPASPQIVDVAFSKPVMVLLTLLAIYLPYGWLLGVGSHSGQANWLKLWPEMPGFVLNFFVFQNFLNNGRYHCPNWGIHVFISTLTLLYLSVMIAFAIELRHRGPTVILVILGISCILGYLAYGMYRA